jgi:hypothetical protein
MMDGDERLKGMRRGVRTLVGELPTTTFALLFSFPPLPGILREKMTAMRVK